MDVSGAKQNPNSAGTLFITKALTTRNVVAVGVGLLAVCYASVFMGYVLSPSPIHMDFFGIWSWARFEIEQPPARIYDHAAQQAYLLSLDPKFPVPMPFPYPPPYLLVIRPLGWLSYPLAQAIWSGATLVAYLAAVSDRPLRWSTVLLALLAPATAVNLFYGQNGFLTAALLVGGIRLAPSRPMLGGIALGLLSYKPQLGFLVAIALAAAAYWRAAFVAALTAVAFAAASLLAFGAAPWTAWFHSLPAFGAIVYEQRARLLHLMPTALSDALALGASAGVAMVIQVAVAILAVAGVWFAFRRVPGKLSVAALAVASILASPYAFIYDLTLVAAAVAFVATESSPKLTAVEWLVLALATLLPAGMLLNAVPPVATLVHLALIGVILMRLRPIASARETHSGGSGGKD
jgi:Glycosyltransferase family 87